MTPINLLWPRWAEIVAHLRKKNVGSWKTIQKAAALLANSYGREQDARFARLAWEELEAAKRPRELWARPPHRIRYNRHFLALVLALGLASLAAPAAANDQVEPGRLYRALGWAAFGGSAGDFASTEYVLSNGGSELNPLQQNRGVRIGSTVAFPVAMNYLTEELREDGHPKLALWFRVAVVALKGYVIVHNLRAGR